MNKIFIVKRCRKLRGIYFAVLVRTSDEQLVGNGTLLQRVVNLLQMTKYLLRNLLF